MKFDRELLIYALLYGSIWFGVHIYILGFPMFWYAIVIASVYATGHYLAGVKRGHIALSADSYALPLPFIIAAVFMGLAWTGITPEDANAYEEIINIVQAYAIAFIGGHASVFLLIFLYSEVFEKR